MSLELYTARSAFVRVVLEATLRGHTIQQLEQQHAQAYSLFPVEQDELAI